MSARMIALAFVVFVACGILTAVLLCGGRQVEAPAAAKAPIAVPVAPVATASASDVGSAEAKSELVELLEVVGAQMVMSFEHRTQRKATEAEMDGFTDRCIPVIRAGVLTDPEARIISVALPRTCAHFRELGEVTEDDVLRILKSSIDSTRRARAR